VFEIFLFLCFYQLRFFDSLLAVSAISSKVLNVNFSRLNARLGCASVHVLSSMTFFSVVCTFCICYCSSMNIISNVK